MQHYPVIFFSLSTHVWPCLNLICFCHCFLRNLPSSCPRLQDYLILYLPGGHVYWQYNLVEGGSIPQPSCHHLAEQDWGVSSGAQISDAARGCESKAGWDLIWDFHQQHPGLGQWICLRGLRRRLPKETEVVENSVEPESGDVEHSSSQEFLPSMLGRQGHVQLLVCYQCFRLLSASPAPHLLISCACSSSANLHRSSNSGLWLTLCQIVVCTRSTIQRFVFCLPVRIWPCLNLTWFYHCLPSKPACLPSLSTRLPKPVSVCVWIIQHFTHSLCTWIFATNPDPKLHLSLIMLYMSAEKNPFRRTFSLIQSILEMFPFRCCISLNKYNHVIYVVTEIVLRKTEL